MGRAETERAGVLGLDSSSDSEMDSDDMQIDHIRTARHPLAHQTPDQTVLPELNEEQDRVICAISESRSSDMIGVAVVNLTMGHVDLIRVVNDDRFRRLVETLWRLPIKPQIFLMLKKVVNQPSKSTLAVCLEQDFPNAQMVPLDREHWNESEGWRMVERFAWRRDVKAIRKNLEHNFYVSCAFSAVRFHPHPRSGGVKNVAY
jgi:DNA mismatch repair protein MSH4